MKRYRRINMASSKEYVDYILEQLSGLEEISCRSMMGEYIVYYREKIAAYICDERFLVKPTAASSPVDSRISASDSSSESISSNLSSESSSLVDASFP